MISGKEDVNFEEFSPILNFSEMLVDSDNQTLPRYAVAKAIIGIVDSKNSEVQIRSLFNFSEFSLLKIGKSFGEIVAIKFGHPQVMPNLCLVSANGSLGLYVVNLKEFVTHEQKFLIDGKLLPSENWRILELTDKIITLSSGK